MLAVVHLLLSCLELVVAEPLCQVRALLRFQVGALMDSLQRLPKSALGCGDFMSCKELPHLLTLLVAAEGGGGINQSSAGKSAADFCNLVPVGLDEVPGRRASVRQVHDLGNYSDRVLTAD